MIDLLGHLGYALTIGGTLMVGRGTASGWLFRFFGESIWISLGFMMGMTSIWAWGIVFAAIDVYTWRKWKCDSSNRESTTISATGL